MTILDLLIKLRDDIIAWSLKNFNRKLNKNLGTEHKSKVLVTDENGNVTTCNAGNMGLTVLDTDVKLSEPLLITEQFGKYDPDGSVLEIGYVGDDPNNELMTFRQLFSNAFGTDKNPIITNPFVSMTGSSGFGLFEVGTIVTPKIKANFKRGSFSYGSTAKDGATRLEDDTGVKVTEWKLTYGNIEEKTTMSASYLSETFEKECDVITVTDDEINKPVTYKVLATHTESTYKALTLLGNTYSGGITAGKKDKSLTITGYRKSFYMYITDGDSPINIDNIDSDKIRKWVAVDSNTELPTEALNLNQMQQMFFAIPSGKVNEVMIKNSVSAAPQTVNKTTVSVEGANEYLAIPYDLFYVSNLIAESGTNSFDITYS